MNIKSIIAVLILKVHITQKFIFCRLASQRTSTSFLQQTYDTIFLKNARVRASAEDSSGGADGGLGFRKSCTGERGSSKTALEAARVAHLGGYLLHLQRGVGIDGWNID